MYLSQLDKGINFLITCQFEHVSQALHSYIGLSPFLPLLASFVNKLYVWAMSRISLSSGSDPDTDAL